jgi:hypothetical protein
MPYRYREIVSFHPLVRALFLALIVVFVWSALGDEAGSTPFYVHFLIGCFILGLGLIFGRLLIELDEKNLTMTWGYLGWPKTSIPLAIIEKSEILDYKPIRQFGGWGIRCGRVRGQMTGCYSMRGNRGVLLSLNSEIRVTLARTRHFLVGSMKPERLQQALET